MNFDFHSVTPRRGSNCVKWDSRPDVLPMWVADMDFPTAPCIQEALRSRVDHGVFGYALVPPSYYEAVRAWFSSRHGWEIEPGSILPIGGVVPAVSVALEALGCRGGKVLMQTPAYNCFFSSLRNMGCALLENPLRYEPAGPRYTIDFKAFERACKEKDVRAFLLCNPQNPAGRLWTREELQQMGEICLQHGIPVISDEIHCELTRPGTAYTPFASLGEDFAQHSVSFVSPTKAFNLAGLQIANIVCANEQYRARLDRVINDWEHCDVGVLGVTALQAAYTPEGAAWLDALRVQIEQNYLQLCSRLEKAVPCCRPVPLEATYLAWVDCSALGRTGKEIEAELLEHEKVWVNGGEMYGDGRFVRINLACPPATLQEGLDRIVRGLLRLKES